MVGLIPAKIILFLAKDDEKRTICSNQLLCELAKKENIEFQNSKELVNLKPEVREIRPEILLIDEDVFVENINNSQTKYASKSCRPFVLVLSNPGHSKEETFEFLRNGADDVIARDVSEEEFMLKIASILRRKSVLEIDHLSELPAKNKTYSILEHCRSQLNDWAVVHIDILNFQSYGVMYGVAQADKAIAKTASFLEKVLAEMELEEYFLGHLGRDNFVVVADTNSFEKIVFEMKRKFKNILEKLYKKVDYENGYIISSAPNKVRRKEGLLDLNIGYCSSIDRNFLSGTDIIEQCVRNKMNSELKNKRVLVLEDDTDFAYLLEETLIREGNDAKLASGLENLIKEVEEFQPRSLILEASKLGPKNFQPICSQLQRFKDEFGLKILIATNVPGHQNFLAHGADVYLPKPYDLETLLKEVRRLRYTHA
jgi:DNA-binding response OmpR family regulator